MSSASHSPRIRDPWLKRPIVLAAIAAVLLVVLRLIPILAQLLLILFGAVAVTVMLDGVSNWLARRTPAPRWLALTLFVLLCLGTLLGTFWLMGERIGEQFRELADRISENLEQLGSMLEEFGWMRGLMQDNASGVFGEMLGHMGGMFTAGVIGVAKAMLLLVIALYLAVDPQFYLNNTLRLAPPSRRKRYAEVAAAAAASLRWWFVGQFSSMAVIGTLTALGLWLVQVPMAFLLGFIAGMLSFVPFAGPIVAAIPGLLVAWGNDPITALYALIVYVAVQALESNLITPLIQKRAVSVPPALLIAGQLLLGGLFGFWGVLWAPPLIVVMMVTVRMLYLEDVLHEKADQG